MRSKFSSRVLLLAAMAILMALPMIGQAQRRRPRPRLRKPAPRVVSVVPIGTSLKVRLNETLSSKDSRVGDSFTTTVIDPARFSEATAHGHVASIHKSGKIQGRTTMTLAFDSIDLPDGNRPLHGYVTRVYGGARTDNEGGVQSGSRTNQTLKRGGIGAAAGAIIGGIAGGGKGAAIGLILGGAGGAGSLAVQGSKELKLDSGTEMLVHVTR